MKSFIFYELKYIRERNLELRALHPLFSAQHFAWIAYPFSDSAAMSCSQTINYRNKNIGTITRFMNMTLDLLNGLTCKVFLKAASNSPPQPRLSFFIKNWVQIIKNWYHIFIKIRLSFFLRYKFRSNIFQVQPRCVHLSSSSYILDCALKFYQRMRHIFRKPRIKQEEGKIRLQLDLSGTIFLHIFLICLQACFNIKW